MADVAARAGVSRALVSIVFRGVPGASAETRDRVRAVAQDLDYRPDMRASRLGSGRARTLGVTFAVGHAFHGDLLRSLYREADAAGYELVLSGVTPDRPDASAVETLLSERCEGLLLLGTQLRPAELTRLAERMPVVSLLRPVRQRGIPSVRTDDALGVRLAVGHLRGLGHRRIAFLDGGTAAGATERRRGYHRGLLASPELVPYLLTGGLTELDGAAGAAQFLGGKTNRPTAVIAFNDRCAIGFIDVVRQVGLSVPQDVSVVGFDDISEAAYPHIALTTVRQDPVRLGAAAIRGLAARLDEGVQAESTVIDPQVVVRGTTTGPRTRTTSRRRVTRG